MKSAHKTVGWLLFILLAVYYFVNRYPGLAFIDSGELALCAHSFGVPHPTGYPLYLILTVPAAFFLARPIIAVTILSGLITALAGMTVYHLLRRIIHQWFPDHAISPLFIAAVTALPFLSPVVAAQGTTNEVYGLGLLTGVATLLLLVSSVADDNSKQSARWLIAAWYIWGLSLCNHMSTIQYVPALALVTVYHLRRHFSRAMLAAVIPAVIIPLTMYAVLPIRAAADPPPVANWGMVNHWGNFFRHVSGWQFNIWLFTGNFDEIRANAGRFIIILYDQYPWPVLVLSLVGFVAAWRRSRLLVSLFTAIMAINIILGINYSIPDIEGYYIQTITTVALFAGIGILWAVGLFRRRFVLGGIVAVLLVWQGLSVWRDNYKGDYTLAEDYAYNICRSAPYGAVVLSEIWDHHGQLYYLQQAELVRPDLRLIDKQLLRRSWYYEMIRNAYPETYARIAKPAEDFVREVKRFESGGTFDPQKLEFYYQAITNILLTRCGPAYIDYKLDYRPFGDHYLRPRGVLFQVDTLPVSAALTEPVLVWRGRGLESYDDWRAEEHLQMIRYVTRQR